MLNAFIINFLWIILGYLIGSINFSIILSKKSPQKIDIKKVGSGNAGATNFARAFGLKYGLVIFILDASKSFWFGFLAGLLQRNVEAFNLLIPQMCLISVIVGHIFPVWFHFKGGKGAATLLGMIASISLFLAIIGTVLFFIIFWFTRYISLGSILVPYFLVAFSFLCQYWYFFDSVIWYQPFWVSPVCLLIGTMIVTVSHRENIIRLIQKKESKFEIKWTLQEKNKEENNNKEIVQEVVEQQEKNEIVENDSFIKVNDQVENKSIIDQAIEQN